MTLNEFKKHCLSLPGAEETYPFGDHAVWFKLHGKAFAWTFVEPFTYEGSQAEPFTFVNLKCDPEQALEWRASHPAVQPGWHQNKKHWNSVFMDGTLQVEEIKQFIDHSYHLVRQKLPKKVRDTLG